MPLLDIQRQGQQLGRVRLGQLVEFTNKQGERKTRPSKLSTFRFTTNSRAAADQIAAIYGGEVREWKGGTEAYEITTTTSEMDVMIPPGEAFIRQDYELWGGGGCERRCDGITARLFGENGETEKPCVCPADGQDRAAAAAKGAACKPTTRLNILLPDIVDLGVWRLDSHGFYAAVELGGKAEFLVKAREAGRILPARLRLEARERKSPGKPTRQFMVPVLEIGVTMRELVTGTDHGLEQALPPAPTALAITAGAPQTPAAPVPPPGAAGTTPAQRVADWAAEFTSAAFVVDLGKQAFADGLLDDQVSIGGDIGPLGKYLEHRAKSLPAGDGIVDAEVLEDEPALDDALAAAHAWDAS